MAFAPSAPPEEEEEDGGRVGRKGLRPGKQLRGENGEQARCNGMCCGSQQWAVRASFDEGLELLGVFMELKIVVSGVRRDHLWCRSIHITS